VGHEVAPLVERAERDRPWGARVRRAPARPGMRWSVRRKSVTSGEPAARRTTRRRLERELRACRDWLAADDEASLDLRSPAAGGSWHFVVGAIARRSPLARRDCRDPRPQERNRGAPTASMISRPSARYLPWKPSSARRQTRAGGRCSHSPHSAGSCRAVPGDAAATGVRSAITGAGRAVVVGGRSNRGRASPARPTRRAGGRARGLGRGRG
jgi:hypothetical protein